ncbi:MAG: DUF4278 domain-containing protein [Leptolyngbyaceae cyanobacterium]
MQLSFRGQSYETSTPVVEATETDETGTALGKQSAKKQFSLRHRQQPTTELIYRGVRYRR